MQATRPRPFASAVIALIVIFGLYTLYSLGGPSNVKVVKTNTPQTTTSPTTKPAHGQEYAGDREGTEDISNDAVSPAESTTVSYIPEPTHASSAHAGDHQIDGLIDQADQRMKEILSRQTFTIGDAAAAYRKRRGRHPPPGFDLWYQYAMENDAVIVEDFWDQIHHDLNPFWAISPSMIRAQTRSLGMAVEVKDGNATATTDWFWHEIWGRMINEVAQYLPDMYIPMNPMDESRLLVQWETITEYMTTMQKERSIVDPKQVITKIKGWGVKTEDVDPPQLPDPKWNGFNPYAYARRACPANSPARQVSTTLSPERILAEYSNPHPHLSVDQYFNGTFVTNYTEASDFCSDASIGGFHGALMQPLTCSNSDVLLPMFGGSKFHVNNEILLPAPMYWNNEERFGGDGHGDRNKWTEKQDSVLWRGTATGGRSKPFTWHLFHRHRFVAMTNGTKFSLAENNHDLIFNEFLRKSAIETLNPSVQKGLAKWLKKTHDVAFTDLVCDENEPDGGCWYTNDEFLKDKPVDFFEQFKTKYLPDIDGNSFSGRYRAFLLSNSLTIKATIYREWHDSRLVAWKHFVPMNNRFSDYYRIMEYFLGDKTAGITGHDAQAEKIALEGRKWSEKVLRKVDMQIYVFRLLLEYGRLTDDDRLKVGWIDDLV